MDFNVVKSNSYEGLLALLKSDRGDKLQDCSSETVIPVKLKIEVINGIVELSTENGKYLRRICENALAADIYARNIVVVNSNNELFLYDDLGNFKRVLTDNVSSATVHEYEITVTKTNGEVGTCDFDGVYLRCNSEFIVK